MNTFIYPQESEEELYPGINFSPELQNPLNLRLNGHGALKFICGYFDVDVILRDPELKDYVCGTSLRWMWGYLIDTRRPRGVIDIDKIIIRV